MGREELRTTIKQMYHCSALREVCPNDCAYKEYGIYCQDILMRVGAELFDKLLSEVEPENVSCKEEKEMEWWDSLGEEGRKRLEFRRELFRGTFL